MSGWSGWIACPKCEERWRACSRKRRVVEGVLARRLREHLVQRHGAVPI